MLQINIFSVINSTNYLTKYSFNENNYVEGINLEIAKGKCIVLMGENGIGKTTSIRIICGLLSQNQGKTEPETIN